MPTNIKSLIVVAIIAAAIFRLAKPIALLFSTDEDFSRRRNVWFILTATGFLSPSFWLFVLVAIPSLTWGARRDTNPIAFYLLLLTVIPAVDIQIPVIGIESLFPLNIYRLLSFCVLIPAVWRLRQSKDAARMRGWTMMDFLLLAYGVLQIAISLSIDSATGSVRLAFLFYIDIYIVYYAVSRSCSSLRSVAEAQAAFCLSCALMASLAAFEAVRQWLLYADFSSRWGVNDFLSGFYLFRGNSLRALASTGNTLVLGFLLAIACGFWLYLQSSVKSTRSRIAVVVVYWIGLLATYSRGPWMGAVAIYFCFAAIGPRAVSRLFKASGVAVLAIAVISASPLGERIAQVLPFMGGSVDSGSFQYRRLLASRTWELFQENPFFGDRLVLSKMEDLRQGVGLIDLVNAYAEVVLFYGLVGLALFAGFILVGLFKTYRLARKSLQSDPNLALLGASLVSCIVGTLLMIGTSSLILGCQKMFYVLAGLAAAYVRLCSSQSPADRGLNAKQNPGPGLSRSAT